MKRMKWTALIAALALLLAACGAAPAPETAAPAAETQAHESPDLEAVYQNFEERFELPEMAAVSEKRRDALFDEIQKKAIAFCIATASVAEIEKMNILNAAMLAMKRAVEGLQKQPAYVLVDGNQYPPVSLPGETVVQGDATSASIAAASVLAKVARDRYMLEQAKQYPQYGFEQHKGYGTKAHYAALARFGASPIHRPSFLKKVRTP